MTFGKRASWDEAVSRSGVEYTDKPIPESVRKAMRLYSLWTEKDPEVSSLWQDVVNERLVDWDTLEFRQLGTAGDILYVSDKWEKDGVLERYHHPFDSRPGVFCASEDAEGKASTLARLLGARSLTGSSTVALTLIAVVEELVIRREGKPHLTLRFADADVPPLCATTDARSLVILTKDRGPIFIRGGSMRVTARGIVR